MILFYFLFSVSLSAKAVTSFYVLKESQLLHQWLRPPGNGRERRKGPTFLKTFSTDIFCHKIEWIQNIAKIEMNFRKNHETYLKKHEFSSG